MKPRNVLQNDVFAAEQHQLNMDQLGDPLVDIETHIDFAALAAEVDRVAPRPVSAQGGWPPVSYGDHGADSGVEAVVQLVG
jgi:transposase, IS5 family